MAAGSSALDSAAQAPQSLSGWSMLPSHSDGRPLFWEPGVTVSNVVSGDFNGDRKPDILWQDSSGACAVWFMNGTVHTSSANLGTVAIAWSIVGSGDFNNDLKSDILWQHTSGARAVWFMNGPIHIGSANLGNVPTTWNIRNF